MRSTAPIAIDKVTPARLDEEVPARARVAFALFVLWATVAYADDGNGWTVIDRERGITVSRRVQPGCAMPSFRGQGRIRGNVLQVLAVILDLDEVQRWAHGVHRSGPIRRIDERTYLLHLASDLPWPVRDRDMVVRTRVEVVRPREEFHISLRCEPDAKPEQEDMIRVRRCHSSLHVRKIDADITEVDYVMTLDPAGYLPRWGVEWVTKATPFKTLVALEEQAARTKGQYTAFVRAWSAAL